MYKMIENYIEQDRTALASITTIQGVGHYVGNFFSTHRPYHCHSPSVADVIVDDTATGRETEGAGSRDHAYP